MACTHDDVNETFLAAAAVTGRSAPRHRLWAVMLVGSYGIGPPSALEAKTGTGRQGSWRARKMSERDVEAAEENRSRAVRIGEYVGARRGRQRKEGGQDIFSVAGNVRRGQQTGRYGRRSALMMMSKHACCMLGPTSPCYRGQVRATPGTTFNV